jgi:Putative Tad-like Flp pilus-assembly
MAMIYVIISMVAMMSFCSLAVDWGRVQTGKTEVRRATDAAARVAASFLAQGTATVRTQAEAIALQNKVDGTGLVVPDSGVTIGIWNKNTKVFSSSGSADNVTTFNAVQVTALRQIPLIFGTVVGRSSCQVTATSVAALMTVQAPLSQFVSAQSNLWLSGEPKGTQGSQPDGGYSSAAHPYKYDVAGDPSIAYGQPGGPGSLVANDYSSTGGKVTSTDFNNLQIYNSVRQFSITVTPGSVIQVSNVSGLSDNEGEFTAGAGNTTADGSNGGSYGIYSDDAASNSSAPGYSGAGNANSASDATGSEHGMSNIATPINSLNGVFLDANAPSTEAGSIPPGLDFSTQSERDYTSLEPQVRQTFFVGDGTTSSGAGSEQQTIIVPSNATRLFLGTMDGHEWSNNIGGFNVTITQFQVQIVH